MQSNFDQLIGSFANLTKDERKRIMIHSAKFVAAEDETDRIHAAYPDLRDKVRVSSYNLHFDASASGQSFWTNRGKEYDMKCEITTPNDRPKTLSLKISYWSVDGRYLTGSIGEDWTTITATYCGEKAEFVADCYCDPGSSFGNAAHGNLKSIFRQVAIDAGLLEGDRAEDSVLKNMIKAFLGNEVCTRTAYNPNGPLKSSCENLTIILKEMDWEYDD